MEENKNIKDVLNVTIVFSRNQKVEYSVPVIKYWQYDIKELKLN